eukprot:SAG31_NODE_31017_length_373_cov_0.967153_1_plen_103_part_01
MEVHSVAFDASGGTLASGSSNTVKLWDVDGSFSMQEHLRVICSAQTLHYAHVNAPSLTHTLEGHSSVVSSVAFDPSGGGTLASGSSDGTVKLWDVASGECLRT